jgi:hypothetical protein
MRKGSGRPKNAILVAIIRILGPPGSGSVIIFKAPAPDPAPEPPINKKAKIFMTKVDF